ncbi:MAG: metallophosphoesterase [Bacteroidia bacterium]|nr:metallophosphoesterase [Bacteroidia bacterium]MBT8279213.1 metallophosphoesterase [Bacteroidia bacterium]NNK59749.1 metallophosphoesterase [Flavobacteriaceae bacterium]
MRKISIVFCISLMLGCNQEPKKSYSFFVAGHTYGSSLEKGKGTTDLQGLHPPFMDKIDFLKKQEKMSKGFLLGDVVWQPKYWPEAIKDIEKIGIPVEVARGNHDGGLKNFKDLFGESYKKYIFKNDLFIILDSNIDNWNISGDQLIFLKNSLRNDTNDVNNVFIFTHHLLWYSPTKFSKPFPNATSGRAKNTNFWSKIEPLLRSVNKPVYLFAGDIGAFSKEYRKKDHIIEYYYHNYDNLSFIATGMGGGVRDNLIIADVFTDGSVKLRLIHLNGDDPNGLGELKDYIDPNFVN